MTVNKFSVSHHEHIDSGDDWLTLFVSWPEAICGQEIKHAEWLNLIQMLYLFGDYGDLWLTASLYSPPHHNME